MLIGVLKLEFRLHGIFSLKEKRSISNSLKQKIRNKFNIAAAEIEEQDNLDCLVLAVITLANETKRVQSILTKVLNLVESSCTEELVNVSTEIFRG